jgi:hypothetical protein
MDFLVRVGNTWLRRCWVVVAFVIKASGWGSWLALFAWVLFQGCYFFHGVQAQMGYE